MSEHQWKSRFGREVKYGKRPMIILYPFGPVGFVFDENDTVGGQLDHTKLLGWWKEGKNNILTPELFERTLRCLKNKYKIPHIEKEARPYIEENSLSTAGYASKQSDKIEITLHPRYNYITEDNVEEAYGVLAHEIAHIFLGHLGEYKYEAGVREPREIKLCDDRRSVKHEVMELEAELTAWLVFNRFGIEKQSVDYMASWLTNDVDWLSVDISRTLRIANTIFEMKD